MPYKASSVTSADGTPIAYREYGRGPGVVLVHGGAGAAQSFDKLATMLAPDFTVYVPDRRGRGKSGPFGTSHGLATECADLEALLGQTGARRVFGLSAGAVIALCTAVQSPVEKLALYEPPLLIDGAHPDAWAGRCERELDRGDVASALVTILKGTGDVGSLLTYAPRFLMRPLASLLLRREKPAADRISFRELIPTIRQDIAVVREAMTMTDRFAAIGGDLLLLGGSRSARDLRIGLDGLARRLPRARRVVLPRVGHTAALDEDQPQLVADQLRPFLR
ncbi:MAG TPA: alpha/beta hydrolase [Kofleriaceae bacterium]|jgi:pimeloyl-ACP methyl ester carboxylesterase